MNEFISIEPAIDPSSKVTFLLDWEITMKCNFDCSYCANELYGGHLNSLPHPKVKECLSTIDFMYQYANEALKHKKKSLKQVVLNIYGGEALFHKDIVEISRYAKEQYQKFKNNWKLTISTTTNASVSSKKIESLSEFIDEWTCSFHSEATKKQKTQFFSNVLKLKQLGKSCKVVVLMHAEPKLFEESQKVINWCKENNIRYLPKQIDHGYNKNFEYEKKQVVWFNDLYNSRSKKRNVDITDNLKEKTDLANVGRSCCGGRLICTDKNYKNQISFVNNKFKDWSCSVNHFFLYVKQVTGEIFNNKDCKINFENKIGPIGYLVDSEKCIEDLKKFVNKGTDSYTTCIKERCYCGLCSPKAKTSEEFKNIFGKYLNEKL